MTPDDFRRLAAAGLTTDQIALVMDIMTENESAHAEADEKRKADQRARWRKWKHGKQDANVSQREQTLANNSRDHVTRGEVKTSNSEIEPQEKKTTKGDAADFVDALRALLDEERLDALVKHRRSRKAPLNALAARLFIGAAERCGITLAEAADHCIERNWLTVKPDWLAAKPPRGSPPLKMEDFLGTVIEQQERRDAGPDQKVESAPQALRAISGGRWAG